MTDAQRLTAANTLLSTFPLHPQLYDTRAGLHLFINRMGSGFANVDIAVHINLGNGFLMRSPRSCFRANLPWGSTVERTVTSLIQWVRTGEGFRPNYWERMVRDHGHWLRADAVARFLETLNPTPECLCDGRYKYDLPKCPLCWGRIVGG